MKLLPVFCASLTIMLLGACATSRPDKDPLEDEIKLADEQQAQREAELDALSDEAARIRDQRPKIVTFGEGSAPSVPRPAPRPAPPPAQGWIPSSPSSYPEFSSW